jgi:hypothetical protein
MPQEPQIPIVARAQEKQRVPAGVIAGVAFMAAVLALLYFVVQQQSQPEAPPAPSPEAEEYLAKLAVADLRMSAEENFLQQQLTYLDGRLSNQGDRTIRRLRLRLYFRDTLNQVVLRVDRDVIGNASTPLGAGESREFRLQFDHIPESWNRQVPQFQLVSMDFQ